MKELLIFGLGATLMVTSSFVCCMAVLANDVTVTAYSGLTMLVGLFMMILADRIADTL